MSRINNLENMKTHPYFYKLLKKISQKDLTIIENFIKENNDLDKNNFEYRLNRLFLDKQKPKNWGLILEITASTNSIIEKF